MRKAEQGNILFIILLAIVLIGALTIAIQSTDDSENANIDNENLVIRTSEVQAYGAELERAVMYIMRNNKSEADIRFAHPQANADYGDLSADGDPSDQVFHKDGGAARFRAPPTGVNDGSAWEFYGGTHIPGIGTGRAELVALLPNVTQDFCDKVNDMNGQTGTPADTGMVAAAGLSAGDCINLGANGRFDDAQQFYATANTTDETSFTQDPNTSAVRPAPQACVRCSLDSENHYYYVLMAR